MPRSRIEHNGFAIIPVQPSHIEQIRQWRNAQMDILRQVAPITLEQQQLYYKQNVWPAMEIKQPSDILLSFFVKGELVGYGGLVHIAWEHFRAEVSFLLNPIFTNKSDVYDQYFSAYLRLLKDLAFNDLGINRLFTETYAFRIYHVEILENNGFRLEGCLREHVWKNGKPIDSLVHGCLKNDQ